MVAGSDVWVAILKRHTFKNFLMHYFEEADKTKKKFIRKIDLLRKLVGCRQLFNYLKPIYYRRGHILYKEGDIADCMYVIITPEGCVEISERISFEETNKKDKDFKEF